MEIESELWVGILVKLNTAKFVLQSIGELCKEQVRYEGIKVYRLVMCCDCKKVEKQLQWD